MGLYDDTTIGIAVAKSKVTSTNSTAHAAPAEASDTSDMPPAEMTASQEDDDQKAAWEIWKRRELQATLVQANNAIAEMQAYKLELEAQLQAMEEID